MLGFAQAEIITGGRDFWGHLGLYLAAGARLWLPVCVTQFGMLAAAWALGCLRLQGGRERRAWVIYPLVLAALLALGLLLPQVQPYLGWLALPVRLPVLAGAGLGAYLPGMALALAWAALGALGLALAARRFNLSRAAQETQAASALAAATLLGNREMVESIKLKQRLRSGARSTLPVAPGAAALTWKGVLRGQRRLSAGSVFDWVVFFMLTLGAALAPDWGSRAMALLFWLVRLNERLSAELRADLNLWPVFQSLPLRARPRLLGEMTPSALLALGVGWLALLAAGLTGFSAAGWQAAALLPFAVLASAYAAAFDVLRQAKADHLLAGGVPGPGFTAVLLGGLALAALVGLLAFFQGSPFDPIPALMAGILVVAGLRSLAERGYGRLGR